MDKELTCNQVIALMKYYTQGKLNTKLTEYVRHHISKCRKCKLKIDNMNVNALKHTVEKNNIYPINTELKNTLSAYIDNELDNSDSIRVKKQTISNLSTRKELETMYRFKQLLQSAYEKTKENTKFDCSKNIMYLIQEGEDYTTSYFNKLTAIFIVIICCIIAGFVYLYL